MMLQQIRIVLVNTTHPGNIGAAARAMKNMGLGKLVLVDPKRFPDPEASARSSRADDILDNAVVVPSLQEAISDCQLVIGTSARQRHLSWPMISPEQMAVLARESVTEKSGTEVALVFGREDRGLTNDELGLCHYHVHIPTDPDFSSLNVAAAVQVLAYELRIAMLEAEVDRKAPVNDEAGDAMISELARQWQSDWDTEWASSENTERFFQHLEQTLVDIDFYKPENTQQLMPKLRRLFQRARLDQNELNILRGVLTAAQKAAERSG